MVICWVYMTVNKKRAKAIANNTDSEYKLLKEIHKSNQVIAFLEAEIRNKLLIKE